MRGRSYEMLVEGFRENRICQMAWSQLVAMDSRRSRWMCSQELWEGKAGREINGSSTKNQEVPIMDPDPDTGL